MEDRPIRNGRVRPYWKMLGFSVITLTVYFYYWLYINIKEIQDGIFGQHEDPSFKTAIVTYWFKIGVLVVTGAVSLVVTLPSALHHPGPVVYPRFFAAVPIVIFFANMVFFYSFAAFLIQAQRRAGLSSFNLSGVFLLYLMSSLVEMGSGVMLFESDMISRMGSTVSLPTVLFKFSMVPPSFMLLTVLGLVGDALWLLVFYIIHSEIERLWTRRPAADRS